MSDWSADLREQMSAQLDHAILHHADAEMRALLAAHRSIILALMTAKAETIVLRDMLARQDEPAPAKPARSNGHALLQ